MPKTLKNNHWVVATHDALRHVIWRSTAWLPIEVQWSEARTVEEARAQLEGGPDVMVVYLDLPGGDPLELVRAGQRLGMKILALGHLAHEARLAFDHGAMAYLDMRDSPEEIVVALTTMVQDGKKYICKRREQAILTSLNANQRKGRKGPALEKLTEAEQAIWHQLAAGKTTREISEERGKSQKTTESHLKNIQKKLSYENQKKMREKAREWLADGL